MSGGRMTDAAFRLAILAVVEERDERRLRAERERCRDRTRLFADTAVYLAANPAATANDICRAVRGERASILEAVRELRAAQKRFGRVENQHPEGTP